VPDLRHNGRDHLACKITGRTGPAFEMFKHAQYNLFVLQTNRAQQFGQRLFLLQCVPFPPHNIPKVKQSGRAKARDWRIQNYVNAL
jgi:hypothetical protein